MKSIFLKIIFSICIISPNISLIVFLSNTVDTNGLNLFGLISGFFSNIIFALIIASE